MWPGSSWARVRSSRVACTAWAIANPDRRYICHFPMDNAIWSFGSGYGGNALLGKNASRFGSRASLGRSRVGWPSTCFCFARRSPSGERTYVTGAFPSACGKQISPCSCRPKDMRRRAGRSRPWAMISSGCGSMKRREVFTAINPELATLASCRGRITRPTQRDGRH